MEWTNYVTEMVNDYIDGDDYLTSRVQLQANLIGHNVEAFATYLRVFLTNVMHERTPKNNRRALLTQLSNTDWYSLAGYYANGVSNPGTFYPL